MKGIANPQSLIGKAESDNLEFKASEVLNNPTKVAREIVAFLNASGGDLWIGIQEQDGIATSLQAIPNAIAASDSLWNHLVDTIEPSPLHDEVRTERIAVAGGGDVIHIVVAKGPRGPYALLKDRGRQFLVRSGARIREMTREEIGSVFRKEATDADDDGKLESRKTAVSQALTEQLGSLNFWWTLVPTSSLKIDFEHMSDDDRKFCRDLLTDSRLSENRSSGWTMVIDHGVPQLGSGGITHVVGSKSVKHSVAISSDGKMTFVAPRTRLDRNWSAGGIDIFPFALIELPVSGFRIASKFMERFVKPPYPNMIVAAVIGGMAGAMLQGGSPSEPFLRWKPAEKFEEADLVVAPFEVDGGQLVEKPDAAAYRLVLRLYEQFGFESSDIPPEFDAQNHVLRFGRT